MASMNCNRISAKPVSAHVYVSSRRLPETKKSLGLDLKRASLRTSDAYRKSRLKNTIVELRKRIHGEGNEAERRGSVMVV